MKKPAIFTRGIIVFPGCKKSLSIGRKHSINAIKLAQKTDGLLILVSQTKPEDESPLLTEINDIGTLCKIVKILKNEENNMIVELKSLEKVLVSKAFMNNDATQCEYQIKHENNASVTPAIKNHYSLLISLIESNEVFLEKKPLMTLIKTTPSFPKHIYKIADYLTLTLKESQDLLVSQDITFKLELLCKKLSLEKHEKKIDREINAKVNDALSKQQKEFYLRQKLIAVKDELSKFCPNEKDAKNLRDKVNNNPYPEDIKKKALEEIGRLEVMGNSQENSIIRSYLDWLLDIPYWQQTENETDIKKVEDYLNKTHYGLEKVKERIMEYLAIKTKSPNSKSPIICLVGPPGVGKSTLAKSIAESLNKKFIQMSLGGVHDESEIRGHRKTYLASMPGRIIKGMKKAGVTNPLFLLDEIDKMSSDAVHGDPSSALLEVLDPEQNSKFIDNYIEEAYDLSNVMFVATANYAEQIPAPLYDRLEIIELTSYTDREKVAIAKEYLIPKTINLCGLTKEEITFEDEAVSYVINRYTKEAGVRELERLINKISRKFVLQQLHKTATVVNITIAKVVEYLDKEIYEYNTKDQNNIPGVVNGMAYTAAGGDLLPIEVTYFPGKGQIVITGNLKETMKESASVALGYVKANAKEFGLGSFEFKKYDIHIHVPSGGIPKDGPSAGVTLTTAIISSLSKKTVPSNIAMTGEITLRGKVLIIGGVKEKVISAFRGGVNEIFIPKSDERYIKDVPVEVRDKITFHLVSQYQDIFLKIFPVKN